MFIAESAGFGYLFFKLCTLNMATNLLPAVKLCGSLLVLQLPFAATFSDAGCPECGTKRLFFTSIGRDAILILISFLTIN